jgi:hypothetical protein
LTPPYLKEAGEMARQFVVHHAPVGVRSVCGREVSFRLYWRYGIAGVTCKRCLALQHKDALNG